MAGHDSTPITTEEIWKYIPGYEAESYQVRNFGRVRRLRTRFGNPCVPPRLLRIQPFVDKFPNPYWYVALSKNGKSRNRAIHIIVAQAFIGPCPLGREVGHKDHNRMNNAISNLEYVTHLENIRASIAAGRKWKSSGVYHHCAKLNEFDVLEIWNVRFDEKSNAREIAKAYGVSEPLIYRIWARQVWKHVLNGERRIKGQLGKPYRVLDAAKVVEMRALSAMAMRQLDICARFNLPQSTVRNVIIRKTWKWL